jgi:hypothetical protein
MTASRTHISTTHLVCDRCGHKASLVDEPPRVGPRPRDRTGWRKVDVWVFKQLVRPTEEHIAVRDLCPNCSASLLDWWRKETSV